ncbi:MAG: pilus assembly protein [Pirellulales bacterium]|nr:pilus assembly protein [Pirellulales bacterium]
MSLRSFPGFRFRRNAAPSNVDTPTGFPPEADFTLEKVCRLCRKYRRGTATVEFAVVAPLFFLLVLGMVEFGRMVMVQQIITNGSREGARIAVLDGTTTTEVMTAVENYLDSAAVSGATVTINPNPPNTAGFGEPVTVTVAVPFDQVSWLPSPMFLSGTTLSASTVMRRETVQ